MIDVLLFEGEYHKRHMKLEHPVPIIRLSSKSREEPLMNDIRESFYDEFKILEYERFWYDSRTGIWVYRYKQ